jgi:hypothetical protein
MLSLENAQFARARLAAKPPPPRWDTFQPESDTMEKETLKEAVVEVHVMVGTPIALHNQN